MRTSSFSWLLGMALAAGCAAATQPSERADKPAGNAPAPDVWAMMPSQSQPEEKKEDPKQEKYKAALKEFLAKAGQPNQEKMLESQKWYDIAQAHVRKLEYDKAMIAVDKAIELWPTNMEARRLKDHIEALQSRVQPLGAEGPIAVWVANVKAMILEATNHIRAGERFLAAKEYEQALREFQEAEVRIIAMPDELPEKGTFLPIVREYQRKIKDRMAEEHAIRMDLERQKNEALAILKEEAEKREVVQRIANLLEQAYLAFDRQQYQACMNICRKILWIDPTYFVAQTLLEDARHVQVRRDYREAVKKRILGWKAVTTSDAEARIPYQDVLNFPTHERWSEVVERAKQATIKSIEEVEEPEVVADVRGKLNSMKISLTYDNEPFENVLAFLREYTNLSIHIDPDAGADPNAPISLRVKDVSVATALKYLLDQLELSYTITEDKIVLLTKPEKAFGKPVLDLYDVRDLVMKISNFPGPKLEISYGGAGGGPGVGIGAAEPTEPPVNIDSLQELITQNISPKTWEQSDLYSIHPTPNNQLVVVAPAHVHREIRDFLERLRSYSGVMVNVNVRFVALFDDELQEIQFDIPPTTASLGSNAPNPNSDIYDPAGVSGANPITPWPWIPGFFQRAGLAISGQVFNTLINADPVFAMSQLPITYDPISGRMRNQGGLGLSFAWNPDAGDDAQAFTTFIRAVDKRTKSQTVQGARITAFNGQQAHVLSVTRWAYIKDIDTGAVGFGGGLDLVIGYMNHGIMLEVRPVVSHDRKYVTMEIKSDFAELMSMRFISAASGAAQVVPQPPEGQPPGTTPPSVPVYAIQLPWLVYQRIQTTAIVPDRGTLVIGGFRDQQYYDAESTLPFYQNIPILNFFFAKRGKRNEKRRMFILVTPEIVDVSEKEREVFD